MLKIEHVHPGWKNEMCIVYCPACQTRQKLTECKIIPTVKRTVYKCLNGCADLLMIVKKHGELRLKTPVGMNIKYSV